MTDELQKVIEQLSISSVVDGALLNDRQLQRIQVSLLDSIHRRLISEGVDRDTIIEEEAAKGPIISKVFSEVTITSIENLWTPVVGKRIRLIGGSFSVSAAVSVLFEDNEAGQPLFQTPFLQGYVPYSLPNLGEGILLQSIDRSIKATSSGAATITGTLIGREE